MNTIYEIFSQCQAVLATKIRLILRTVWTCSCIVATLATMAWQLSNYYNGKEETVVDYRRYNDIDYDLYPSLSLCWTMVINEEKLKMYGAKFNSTAYGKFLAGEFWDKDMLTVEYDNVMPDFDDYIVTYGYKDSSWRGQSLYPTSLGNQKKHLFKETSFLGDKCFTIDLPFRKGLFITRFHLHFKSSIFGKGGRLDTPANTLFLNFDETKFKIILHYRNQLVSAISLAKDYWPPRAPGSPNSYLMRLMVGGGEVMVRRNTNRRPCSDGVPEYDKQIVEYLMNRVRCKPPYWKSTSALKNCSTQNQLWQLTRLYSKAMFISNREAFYTVKPQCRSLERIQYDFVDVETPQSWRLANGTIGVVLSFQEVTYKEGKYVPGMDVQGLIGEYLYWNRNMDNPM